MRVTDRVKSQTSGSFSRADRGTWRQRQVRNARFQQQAISARRGVQGRGVR
ncbi:hypothetical protein AB0I53_12810 [Saccharopolyspora sp. NPDC050389]|uniref:hypothetical protein n=1 Tax=Saccharopolyspora sp. NPDC050389 TaxID=3155516 RepID=UPI003401EE89